MQRTFSISQKVIKLESPGIEPADDAEAPVYDRANRIPGYEVDVLADLTVLIVGCGGLGGEISHGLVRNGVGNLVLCDHDSVELSNLNRQKFYAEDLYKNKALQLARNLVAEAVQPLAVTGLAMDFQASIRSNRVGSVDVVICGVDNDQTRVDVARWALNNKIPAIFTGVNVTADFGYVFIQSGHENTPCFGCLFPDSVDDDEVAPCGVGATVAILKAVAGPVTYALSALFMPEVMLRWHYKEIYLSGAGQDGNRVIRKRADCPLC